MSRSVKSIDGLFHQFSLMLRPPRPSAIEVAEILEVNGLIEYVEFGGNGLPSHYKETDRMKALRNMKKAIQLILKEGMK